MPGEASTEDTEEQTRLGLWWGRSGSQSCLVLLHDTVMSLSSLDVTAYLSQSCFTGSTLAAPLAILISQTCQENGGSGVLALPPITRQSQAEMSLQVLECWGHVRGPTGSTGTRGAQPGGW